MENFDLIDDYLRGQLNGPEKEAFESQFQADPSLQSEVALQQQLIEGIKKARIAQLKSMLSQVPVTGAMTGGGIGLSTMQIAAGVITSAIVATGTLFYFQPWKTTENVQVKTEQPLVIETVAPKEEQKSEVKSPEPTNTESKPIAVEPKKESKKKETKEPTVMGVQTARPNIQVVDPTGELASDPTDQKGKVEKTIGAISGSKIEVENIDDNKQYAFHYQFNQGKLMLYGKFDKELYEIIEVNGTSHSVFLYYKDLYYLLDAKESVITPLKPIRDNQLIKKLKEYRKG